MGWKSLFSFVLLQGTHVVTADNSSVIYSPTIGGQQQVLWGADGEATYNDYLKLSLKHELQKRLSTEAGLFLKGEQNFGVSDARYTDYKRPQYVAVVQVAEEQDVVETVRLTHAIFSDRSSLSIGELRTRKKYSIRSPGGGSQPYKLPSPHQGCHCD